jgi:hypothetical protein
MDAQGLSHSPPHCWPSCLLFADGSGASSALCPPASLVCLQQPLPPPLDSSFQFHFFIQFFLGGESFCPGRLCWFIPGVAKGYPMMLGAHLFGLPKVSQAHLELVAGGCMEVATHLFSQCVMAWRRLPQARGSECQSFNSPWCFTSTKYGSSVSPRSLIHGAHSVCVCDPVTILDLPTSGSSLY